MKAEILDQFPFLFVCPLLQRAKPRVNTIFGEVQASLRGKNISTLLLTSPMLNIVVEGTACFIEQINIAKLLSLVSNMYPADFRTDMGMLHQEMRNVAHTASCPISQCKERFSTQVIALLD